MFYKEAEENTAYMGDGKYLSCLCGKHKEDSTCKVYLINNGFQPQDTPTEECNHRGNGFAHESCLKCGVSLPVVEQDKEGWEKEFDKLDLRYEIMESVLKADFPAVEYLLKNNLRDIKEFIKDLLHSKATEIEDLDYSVYMDKPGKTWRGLDGETVYEECKADVLQIIKGKQ